MFAKKRNAVSSTQPSSVPPTATTAALTVLATAASEIATTPMNVDLPQQQTATKFSPMKNSTTVMNNTTITNPSTAENSSVANLSRFDTDLMSKNTQNAAAAGVVNGGVNNNNAGGGAEAVEVPKSIPTSGGDDVDDDLTEATAASNIFQHEATNNNNAEKEASAAAASKTSPFFSSSHNTTNAQVKENQKGNENIGNAESNNKKASSPPAIHNTANGNSGSLPRECKEIVIPGVSTNVNTAVQQPTNTHHAASAAKTTTESILPTKEGRILSPHQGTGTTARVSLSPRPGASAGGMNVNTMHNRATSLSPKVASPHPRPPSHNAAVANRRPTSFSPKGPINENENNDDDDNSIVIPGAPAAIANNNNDGQSNITLGNSVVGAQRAGQMMNNNSTKSGTTGSSTLQRPILNRQQQKKNPTPFMMNRNTMTTSNNCDIVNEKVAFAALPEAQRHQTCSKNATSNVAALMGSNNIGRAAAANPNSTAITPNHRHGAVANQITTATSFGRSSTGTNNEGGSGTNTNQSAVTPAPHNDHQMMVDPVSAGHFAQPKTTTMMEVEEEEVPQQRPRSKTLTSPPASLPVPPQYSPGSNETPKASNVNPSPQPTAPNTSYTNSATTFQHTDKTFDELLSQFVNDIQEGTDIFDKGQNDLLELEVNLTHAGATINHFRDGYMGLIDDIEDMQRNAEMIMAEL